jgi:putative spermidine/putrescine transport system permease protein
MSMKFAKITFATLAILFLVAPLIAILPLAFTSSVILTYPIPSWSLRWFEELFTADAWRRAIINSLIIGTGTTLLATVLGTAASLGLRNRLLFSAARCARCSCCRWWCRRSCSASACRCCLRVSA